MINLAIWLALADLTVIALGLVALLLQRDDMARLVLPDLVVLPASQEADIDYLIARRRPVSFVV